MKTLSKKLMSLFLALTMVFSLSATAFAAKPVQTIVTDDSRSFTVLSSTETNYGTMYFVKEDNKPQPRTFWDVLDIAMAGKSWSDLLKDPSWSNFGWAVLDTAALLPLLPSTAYVREGGKVLLKADDFLKFAKTSKGKKAIKSAMKTYDKVQQNIKFAAKAAQHMNNPNRSVPLQILEKAIKHGVSRPDPQGSRATMYYITMYKNGKKYNLEVLFDNATNTIFHFKYSPKALGPLPKIK